MYKFSTLIFLFLSISSYAVIPEDFLYKNSLNVVCKVGSPLQEDLIHCVSRAYLESDQKLNTEYKNKMRILDENRKSNLLKSQRIWLKSRKTKCDFEYKNAEGGREAEIYIIDCYAQENTKRINFLSSYK